MALKVSKLATRMIGKEVSLTTKIESNDNIF